MAEPEKIVNVSPPVFNETIPILLAPWILQDGNYDDFIAGTERQFAVDFYTHFDRPLRRIDSGKPGLRPTGSYAEYEVTARVAYNNIEGEAFRQANACWVIDLGAVMAYDTHSPQIADGVTPQVGDLLRGTLSLGVDCFDYFERLADLADIPPLIYTWDIERVEIDETPREAVHHGDPRFGPHIPASEGPIYLPGLAREKWRPLSQTRMWDDDGGPYRLHSALRDSPPTKAFTMPQRTRE